MKKWKQILAAFALIAGMSSAMMPAGTASAINVFGDCNGGASQVCKAAKEDTAANMARIIIDTLLYLIGIIAVIMIIVGGVKYTASNGDASRIKSAKDTITYAIVGLVLALLSFIIVNFVISRL